MNEWVDVKDDLPECRAHPHGGEVKVSSPLLLYCARYGILTGYMESDDINSYDWIASGPDDDQLIRGITHWMLAPEAPDE